MIHIIRHLSSGWINRHYVLTWVTAQYLHERVISPNSFNAFCISADSRLPEYPDRTSLPMDYRESGVIQTGHNQIVVAQYQQRFNQRTACCPVAINNVVFAGT